MTRLQDDEAADPVTASHLPTASRAPFFGLGRRGAAALAASAVAVGALAGGLVLWAEYPQPTTYRSEAVLLFDQTRAIATADSGGVLQKLSLMRVQYADLVGTAAITAPVARTTGLPQGVVRGAVSATAPSGGFLLRVDATTSTPRAARTLAGAAADELVRYSGQQQRAAGVPAAQQVTVEVVTPAGAAAPVPVRHRRAIAAAVFVFVVVTAAVVLMALLLARRRRR